MLKSQNKKTLIKKLLAARLILNFLCIKCKSLWNMSSNFLKCKKDTKDVDTKMLRTKNDRKMLSSKCTVCEESRIL